MSHHNGAGYGPPADQYGQAPYGTGPYAGQVRTPSTGRHDGRSTHYPPSFSRPPPANITPLKAGGYPSTASQQQYGPPQVRHESYGGQMGRHPDYNAPPTGPGAYADLPDTRRRSGENERGGHGTERGLGASVLGAAGGGLVGHQLGGGKLGALGGAVAGAIGANALEKHHEKSKQHHHGSSSHHGSSHGGSSAALGGLYGGHHGSSSGGSSSLGIGSLLGLGGHDRHSGRSRSRDGRSPSSHGDGHHHKHHHHHHSSRSRSRGDYSDDGSDGERSRHRHRH